jgi:hypothetical protein
MGAQALNGGYLNARAVDDDVFESPPDDVCPTAPGGGDVRGGLEERLAKIHQDVVIRARPFPVEDVCPSEFR